MTTETRQHVFEHIGKLGTIVTPLGIILILLLQTQFVSRKEFTDTSEKLDSRVMKIEIALVQLVEQNKVNDRQDLQINDHEHRLRELEHPHEKP
jgi:hypothetical protein